VLSGKEHRGDENHQWRAPGVGRLSGEAGPDEVSECADRQAGAAVVEVLEELHPFDLPWRPGLFRDDHRGRGQLVELVDQFGVVDPHGGGEHRRANRPWLTRSRLAQLDQVIDAINQSSEHVPPEVRLVAVRADRDSASKSSGHAGVGLSASDIVGACGMAGSAGHHDGGESAPLSRRPRTAQSSDTCSAFGESISVATPTSLPCAEDASLTPFAASWPASER
jgi:hypothetical protein